MHVVVLGGGYAGLAVTRRLERQLPADVELTLVNDSPDHVLQHELHRAVRRPAVATDITVSLTHVTDQARVHVATVETIDRDERCIELTSGRQYYDLCVVCLGAETAYYGLETVRTHATPLKRLEHARTIRADFLETIRSGSQGGRVVVGGAGLSGVQVAGELAALAREEGQSERTEIVLLEQLADVAPGFPESFQSAVRRSLEAQGVDVRTGTTVTGADGEAVDVRNGDSVEYDQLVWTGGIRGPGALDGDRPTVGADLRLDDRTFVCGDAARVLDVDDAVVPASAQSALREARTAAENVTKLVDGERAGHVVADDELAQFRFQSPGWVVSIGDDAVAKIGPKVLTGAPARAAKASVGAGYLAKIGAGRNARRLALSEWQPGSVR